MLSNRAVSAAQTWLKQSGQAAVTADHWVLHTQMHTNTRTRTHVHAHIHTPTEAYVLCLFLYVWKHYMCIMKMAVCRACFATWSMPPPCLCTCLLKVRLSTVYTSPRLPDASLHPASLPPAFSTTCSPVSSLFVLRTPSCPYILYSLFNPTSPHPLILLPADWDFFFPDPNQDDFGGLVPIIDKVKDRKRDKKHKRSRICRSDFAIYRVFLWLTLIFL